ncbi:hypothetical protein [Streptomyces sp. NPDC001970]
MAHADLAEVLPRHPARRRLRRSGNGQAKAAFAKIEKPGRHLEE